MVARNIRHIGVWYIQKYLAACGAQSWYVVSQEDGCTSENEGIFFVTVLVTFTRYQGWREQHDDHCLESLKEQVLWGIHLV